MKPAAEMGKSEHSGKGDVIGLGGRHVILRLVGRKATYQLYAALNVNDASAVNASFYADLWYQVAVAGEPTADKK